MSFIVIEGLDGSGKSTQVQKICDYYRHQGVNLEFLHFPNTSEEYFGMLISRFLRGEFGNIEEVDTWVVAMLFAGNRWAYANKLKKWIDDKKMVIVDRYVFSNITYQAAKLKNETEKQKLREWIYSLEYNQFKIPKPDINIWLDVPVSFVESQLNKNREGGDRTYLKGVKDIHETNIDFQQLVYNEYTTCCNLFPELIKVICYNQNGEMLNENTIFEKLISTINQNLK